MNHTPFKMLVTRAWSWIISTGESAYDYDTSEESKFTHSFLQKGSFLDKVAYYWGQEGTLKKYVYRVLVVPTVMAIGVVTGLAAHALLVSLLLVLFTQYLSQYSVSLKSRIQAAFASKQHIDFMIKEEQANHAETQWALTETRNTICSIHRIKAGLQEHTQSIGTSTEQLKEEMATTRVLSAQALPNRTLLIESLVSSNKALRSSVAYYATQKSVMQESITHDQAVSDDILARADAAMENAQQLSVSHQKLMAKYQSRHSYAAGQVRSKAEACSLR